MDIPIQPAAAIPAAPAAEAGVTQSSASEGAEFLKEMLLGSQPVAPQPVAPQPVAPQPVAPQPVAPQPVAPQPVAPQPVAPQPVAPQSAVDYGQRYTGQPADPLAGLQEAPALPVEQQVAPPQNLNDQQSHAWAAIRAQSNANRRAAEEYRTKYNQAVEMAKRYQDEKTAFTQQLSDKDAEITRLQDEIGRMDLTRSQAFRDKYDAPIQQVVADMARTLQGNGYGQEEADSLARQVLSVPREQVPELLRELPTHVQGVLMVKAEEADGMFAARDQALDDWRTSAEGLAAVQERGEGMVHAQHVEKMVARAAEILHGMPLASLPPSFQVTDPTFVADREAKEKQFRAWAMQAPEEQKYAAMFEGFMAPKTYEMLEQTMRENVQLRSMLMARGRLAAPPVSSAPGIMPVPPAPPPPAPPTVQHDGYSAAPSARPAEDFLRGVMAGMAPAGVPLA